MVHSHREKKYILRILKEIKDSIRNTVTGPLTVKSEKHLEDIERNILIVSELLLQGTKNEVSCPTIGLDNLQVRRDVNNKVEDIFSSDIILSKEVRNIFTAGLNAMEQTNSVDLKAPQNRSQIYENHLKEMQQASKPCPTFSQILVKPRNAKRHAENVAKATVMKPLPVQRMITKSASDEQIAKARGNAIRALSPPITLPKEYVPKYYPKPGHPEYDPTILKKKVQLTPAERDEMLQLSADKKARVKRRLTFFPDQNTGRSRSQTSHSETSQIDSSNIISPPQLASTPKKKRGQVLERTIEEEKHLLSNLPEVENDSPPTYMQNHADRMRRVETRPFQSPPRPFQARGEERAPTPTLSPPPNPPASNVFMWNGARAFIPDWALQPMSAWQVGRDPQLQIPLNQAPRLQMAHGLRRVPMDGVNRVEDIIIREGNDEGERTILIQATTKERGISPSHSDLRSLHIPLQVVPSLLRSMEAVEVAVLPPAKNDHNLDDPNLFLTNVIVGRFNYISEITLITEMQGDERLVRVYREDRDRNNHGGIAFPWMFTTLFNAKLRNVYKEVCGNLEASATSANSTPQ
jgi:hypothetical protein